jgi:hypothetical protein
MKSFSFFFFFFFIATIGFSQGNLQFNQVLNLSFTSGGTFYPIPVGKVWKLENVGMSSYASYFTVSVAGQQIFLKCTNTGYTTEFNSFPYWVNGGQNVGFSGLNAGVVSIIEFNVVP